MSTKPLREGFTCECGKEHKFPTYVYAHWRELLIHTCDVCGAKHEICAGAVNLISSEKEV